MVTKKDIAKIAGVSPATVSNFFNGKKKMSTDTQNKILQAASELNYTPDKKSLSAFASRKNIFLVVDDIFNPHYAHILNGMQQAASQHSLFVSMLPIWNNIDEFCNSVIDANPIAIYFAFNRSVLSEFQINLLQSHNIMLFFSWENFEIDFDELTSKAVKYLLDLGHTRIAYLSGLSINSPDNIRYLSYQNALRANNLEFDYDLVIDGVYPYETTAKYGYWSVTSFLKKKVDFTAIIALNDLLAIGAINALTENGLSIPQDVSVIGCDNIMISENSNPPLTTLKISATDMGSQIMFAIIRKLNQPDLEILPIKLQTELIIRKTTGGAKQNTD